MSEDIPYATPYPWDNPSTEESIKSSNDNLRRGKVESKFVGSGFASLRQNAFGSQSKMGTEAKNMLMTLLQRHNVKIATNSNNNNSTEVDGDNDNKNTTTTAAPQTQTVGKLYGGTSTALCLTTSAAPDNSNKKKKMANIPGTLTDDSMVIGLARKGNLSIFSSILHLIENAKQPPVTTKHIIRHCCLTLRPQDIPGALDAKEMVLASLQFLCSKFEPTTIGAEDDNEQQQLFLNLPLLKPIQEVGDLEKRNYQQVGEWKLSDIHDQLLRMETIFLESSPTATSLDNVNVNDNNNFLWVRREAFCPHLGPKDESSFCLKGTIPASASAKKHGNISGTRKRKASTTQTSTTTAVAASAASIATNNDHINAAAHNNNDTSSGGPVVEATVVADGDSPEHE